MPSYDATYSGHPFTLRLNVSSTEDIASNSSTVSWSLQTIKTGNFTPHVDDGSATWTFNDESGHWSPYSFNGAIGQTVTMASGSFTVAHDAAGNATIGLSWSANGEATIGTAGDSKSWTLPNIPRQASAPTATGVVQASTTSATLSWTAASAPAGAPVTSYTVQASTDSGFATIAKTVSAGASATSATVTGLTPGTAYYLRVQAVNAAGGSAWSGTEDIVILAGVRVKIGGVMKDCAVSVKINGTFVPCDVKTKRAGAMVGLH